MTFIEDFLDWTQGVASPQVFRRWSAVSLLSGAMERRCYMRTSSGVVYPNLFVLLVAPPGIGKSEAIDRVHELWAATGLLCVAPRSLTRAGLEDNLVEAQQQCHTNGFQLYHSLQVAAPEFGTLVKAHDTEFLNTLNVLYDCGTHYDAYTRSQGKISIDNPQINIIAGTQPQFLAEVLPAHAFGMGFTSRLVMVFSAERVRVNLFPTEEDQPYTSKRSLVKQLQEVCKTAGEFFWEKKAQQEMQDWLDRDLEPKPDHPKLQHYLPRRLTNILKLSMVCSISESLELVVRPHHLEEAAELLLDAEAQMPEIFQDMQASGDQDVIVEAWNFLRTRYQRNNKKPVRENELHGFLQQRVPTYKISSIVESMLKAGWLENSRPGMVEGARSFTPKLAE